jgi:glucose dehydrogenase
MYSRNREELVIAMDAATGKTLWEYAYDASGPRMDLTNGPGPHSTPLVRGDRVYTIGIRAHMHALDKKSGKPDGIKNSTRTSPAVPSSIADMLSVRSRTRTP